MNFTSSSIKGYRSAISRTIHLSGGPDFGSDEFISLLVNNFSLERPRQRVLIPSWDNNRKWKRHEFHFFFYRKLRQEENSTYKIKT
jgi:hypothetical protein